MIGRFRSILFVSVFQGLLAVAIIMIDCSEKSNRQLSFELQSLHVIENCNNLSKKKTDSCGWVINVKAKEASIDLMLTLK